MPPAPPPPCWVTAAGIIASGGSQGMRPSVDVDLSAVFLETASTIGFCLQYLILSRLVGGSMEDSSSESLVAEGSLQRLLLFSLPSEGDVEREEDACGDSNDCGREAAVGDGCKAVDGCNAGEVTGDRERGGDCETVLGREDALGCVECGCELKADGNDDSLNAGGDREADGDRDGRADLTSSTRLSIAFLNLYLRCLVSSTHSLLIPAFRHPR